MPLNRGLVGVQRWFGQFGNENNFVLTRIGTWLVGWLVMWAGQLV